MTYSEIWHRIATSYEDGEARAIARILIEELFGLSYTDIVCGATDQLSADDTLRLDTAVRRIEQGEPLQHVLGYADFCGNHFGVNASVLIPRPETEWLVDEGERLITRYAKGWKLERISRTALAVLRCAICEILYMDDIPNAAAINEAVELDKGYDEPDVVSFVNGVLGGFMRGEIESRA